MPNELPEDDGPRAIDRESRCWHDSRTEPFQWRPRARKPLIRLYRRATALDRRTHAKGHHGGVIGPTALKVLETLIFGFIDYSTGRLDPSHAGIARKAGVCVRSVANALKRLKDLKIIDWVRRCHEEWTESGRWVRKQDTNAYIVGDPAVWDDARPAAPPIPHRDTYAPPRMPGALDDAVTERKAGDLRSVIRALESDPDNLLARTLARLGRAVADQTDARIA